MVHHFTQVSKRSMSVICDDSLQKNQKLHITKSWKTENVDQFRKKSVEQMISVKKKSIKALF